MVMVTRTGRTFVYGRFISSSAMRKLPPSSSLNEIAIEILREYSATEFVGKLYTRNVNQWVPIPQQTISNFEWFKLFSKNPRFLRFEMDGGGEWEVLHFRNESDELGPYTAIALRQAAVKHALGPKNALLKYTPPSR